MERVLMKSLETTQELFKKYKMRVIVLNEVEYEEYVRLREVNHIENLFKQKISLIDKEIVQIVNNINLINNKLNNLLKKINEADKSHILKNKSDV